MSVNKKLKLQPHKPSELLEFRQGPYISQNALQYVVEQLHDTGKVPTAASRRTQARAKHNVVDEPTPCGPVLRTIELPLQPPVEVSVLNPPAMIWRTVRECPVFRKLMKATLERHPCSAQRPWGIILYWDEVSPTDPLNKGSDGREVQAVYFSFIQFGSLLYCEDLWFVAATARSILTNKADGNMSNFVAMILKIFDPDGIDVRLTGFNIDLSDELEGNGEIPYRFFFEHVCSIADFKAISQVLGGRGATATIPCPKCRNIADHKSSLALNSPDILPLTSTEPDKWKQRSDEFVRALHVKLRDAHACLAPDAFVALQQRLGWTYNARSLLSDEHLAYKAMSTLLFDWMHVWCVDGVFERTLDNVMDACKRTKACQPSDTHEYLQGWHWPKQFCSGSSVYETGRYQATASESLSAYPVLRKFFAMILRNNPHLQLAIDAFMLACDVLDILQQASRGGSTPRKLHDATILFCKAFQAAFGAHNWVLKFHLALHLAAMWAHFGVLPNCFSLERKHKVVKRNIKDHMNTRAYEKSAMQDICLQHWHKWQSDRRVGLMNPRACTEKARLAAIRDAHPCAVTILTDDVFIAASGARYHANDVVRTGAGVGELWWHFEVDGAPCTWSCISFWPTVVTGPNSARCEVALRPRLCRNDDITAAAIHKRGADGKVLVVWPWCVN